jgi:hypothetical protein
VGGWQVRRSVPALRSAEALNDPFQPHNYENTVYWINGGNDELAERHNKLWQAAYLLQRLSERLLSMTQRQIKTPAATDLLPDVEQQDHPNDHVDERLDDRRDARYLPNSPQY